MNSDHYCPPRHPPALQSERNAHRATFNEPDGSEVSWLVGIPRVVIGHVVFTAVLVVLLWRDAGTPLAVAFGPGLAIAVTSLAGFPVRRIPRIRHWWIRYGEIAMVGIVLSLGLTAYGLATGTM